MNLKPRDVILIHQPGTTVYRTVHSLTYDTSGINTTQGDWFPLDDPSAVTILPAPTKDNEDA